MAIATPQDILDRGILPNNHSLDITGLIAQAESRVVRLLNQQWYPKFLKQHPGQNPKLNPSRLAAEQWRSAMVNYSLAYVILPKLATLTSTNYDTHIAHSHLTFENAWRHLIEYGFDYDTEGEERSEVEALPEVNYLRMRT